MIAPRLAKILSRLEPASILFALISLIFGLIFIAVNPPFWGNDGMSQFARAYQVAQGGFAPHEISWGGKGRSYGGEIPSTAWQLYEHAAQDLGSNPPEPGRMILNPEKYAQLEAAAFSVPSKNTVWFTNTAAYSPVPYLPPALGVLIAESLHLSLGAGLSLMATLSLLSYVALGFFALRALRTTRIKWLAFALALLPPALYQVSTITADALTNGLALLLFALFVKSAIFKQSLSRLEAVALVGTAIALPLAKPTYVILVALVAIVPAALVAANPFLGRVAKWGSIGVAVVLWLIWTVLSRDTADVLSFYRADYATSEFGTWPQVRYTITHPVQFLGDVVRTFFYRDNFYYENLLGSSNIRVPGTAMLLSGIAVLFAAGNTERLRLSRTPTIVLTATAVLSFVAVFATLYLSFTPVGFYLLDGVQGRYFFPLLPFFALVLLRFVPARLDQRSFTERSIPIACVVLICIALVATLAKYAYLVWR